MEHPDRKPNRLTEYDYSTNGAYFITICTQGKKKILSSIVGGGAHDAPNLALTDIGKIVRIHIVNSNRIPGITVDKFVIMPDHIHLIILVDEITSKGTSRAPSPTNAVIPHFVSTFKRFCHRDVGEQIFQHSYYDHVIRNQQDYDEIWQYIENNPRKWFLQKHSLLQGNDAHIAPTVHKNPKMNRKQGTGGRFSCLLQGQGDKRTVPLSRDLLVVPYCSLQ